MILLSALAEALATQPRMPLASLPTPLIFAPRLSAELGSDVWIKRDDLTGVALGGNKVRKLEYLFGAARLAGTVDTVVTVGAAQSNHARTTAAAARMAGWDCHLVLSGDMPAQPTGNLVIANAVGADLHFVGSQSWHTLDQHARALCAELAAAGRRPLFIPMGGSTPIGALGYVNAYLELLDQLREAGIRADAIIHPTSTGGTQAGMDFAHRAVDTGPQVIGIAVAKTGAELTSDIVGLQTELGELLDIDPGPAAPFILDQYLGPGYGAATHGAQAASALLASTESLLTDHVYTAKALNAVVDRAALSEGPIVFWHTGGVPSVFADTAPASFWSPRTSRVERLQSI